MQQRLKYFQTIWFANVKKSQLVTFAAKVQQLLVKYKTTDACADISYNIF